MTGFNLPVFCLRLCYFPFPSVFLRFGYLGNCFVFCCINHAFWLSIGIANCAKFNGVKQHNYLWSSLMALGVNPSLVGGSQLGSPMCLKSDGGWDWNHQNFLSYACCLCWEASNWSRGKLVSCSCSIAKACLTLCDPMNCSIQGFPVPHHLLEFAQTHVHWVGDVLKVIKIIAESRMVAARGWGGESGRSCLTGTEFQICKMKIFWRATKWIH